MDVLAELAYAWGRPQAHGLVRCRHEDFQVDEQLGFELAGSGEHVFLQIRKRGLNTRYVAERLAACAGVRAVDVGYAGLKDRRALTTQWFSVYYPKGAEPAWHDVQDDNLHILQIGRHVSKLRRGTLAANGFHIRIRGLDADVAVLQARLRRIETAGVPNYFGPQRFGHDGNNLEQADALLQRRLRPGRYRRGLYLSAARAWLFNQVLAHRVAAACWREAVPGDVLQNAAGDRRRVEDPVGAAPEVDWLPTGPMWGRGRLATTAQACALEQEALASYGAWRDGLEHAGLQQERRALVLRVAGLRWQWPADDVLDLTFQLPAGGYATSVLRELLQVLPESEPGAGAGDLGGP